ncbi:MAG: hypothetical protein [Cressdnaviricota sp.]|nr:MAG: hypothetical protein [Cressdnaviricota sp.]
MAVRRSLTGDKSIQIKCASKGCPLGCVLSFKTPIELWSVSEEKLAALLSLPCERLAKEAAAIAKQDGRTRVTSCAEKVGR